MDWSIFPLIVVIGIALLALIIPRVTTWQAHRPLIVSAIGAFLLFIGRMIYIGIADGTSLWNQNADKAIGATATLLTINCIIELIKWIIMQVAEQRSLRLPRFLMDLIGFVILLLFVPTIAGRFFQVELTGLLVGSTVVSAIIALSLQSLLSSFFAGIALQIESPFRPDDWVEVDGQEGRVVRMNWRTLSIVTRQNESVILPNGSVAQQKIINYSRPSKLQAIDVFIGVGYSHPPGEVKALLKRSVEQVVGVVKTQPPQIILWEYADSAIVYRVRFWIREYGKKFDIIDSVQTNFWYALKRAGFGIPFPQRDVHFFPVEPESEEDEHEKHMALGKVIESVELFATLSDEQCLAIASGAEQRLFTKGEVLVKQGQTGDSLFIIMYGQVSVVLNDENGHNIPLANRQAGDFLGEMSLLTGEPRAATVVAKAETEVVVINAETFSQVVAEDREILDRLMDALEKRRSNSESRLAEHQEEVLKSTQQKKDFKQRVYRFLGL